MYTLKENNTDCEWHNNIMSTSQNFRRLVLTLIPSQRDTALKGLKARRVLIDLNAGISVAPAQITAKFTNDNYKTIYMVIFFNVTHLFP